LKRIGNRDGVSDLMRQVASFPRRNDLASAPRELGRLERTFFTLDWIEEPDLRGDTSRELDKGEARNSLARITKGKDTGVLSARTWRLADLGAKHAMILAGLGWGAMPGHMVDADIGAGRLVELRLSSAPDHGRRPRMLTVVVHRRDAQLGPAGQWLLNRALADGRLAAG
jgi:DNA-binding transcriptional LysR family regulator